MTLNYNGEAVRDRGTAQRLAMTNIYSDQINRYGVRTIGATDTVFNIYADNGRVAGRYETQDEAYEEAQRIANENNITVHVANSGLRVATATPQSGPGASEVPEVPMDVAQNFPQDRTDGRDINFGNQFSGQWKVMIDGEEVYRFRGVGNSQADANRIAQLWLRDQRGQGLLSPAEGADLEVVPVMV
jgi:hypothetical protein